MLTDNVLGLLEPELAVDLWLVLNPCCPRLNEELGVDPRVLMYTGPSRKLVQRSVKVGPIETSGTFAPVMSPPLWQVAPQRMRIRCHRRPRQPAMPLKLKGPPTTLASCGFESAYDVVSGDTYIGYPIGWSHTELIMFLSACLAFWIEPRSGFRFLRKISSWSCPAHKPRTHSRLTYKARGKNSIEPFDF